MIGVLVVNALGYHDTPSSRLLGEVVPADSAAAGVVVGTVAAFVQGKAYPVLSFLFGMGLAYSARSLESEAAAQRARQRAQRLLVLGLAHGTLLYFGDILTLYALVALSLAGHVHEPWMLLGIAAARLRVLTHARWAVSRDRAIRRALWPVLGLNAAYGALYAAGADDTWSFTLEAASALWSLPLAALYVVAAARAWQRGRRRWALALAPLGQRTLTLYVAASLTNVLLFSGAGLGLRPSTVHWVAFSLLLWLLGWAWAVCSTRRGPLEAWMARR